MSLEWDLTRGDSVYFRSGSYQYVAIDGGLFITMPNRERSLVCFSRLRGTFQIIYDGRRTIKSFRRHELKGTNGTSVGGGTSVRVILRRLITT